MWSKSGDIPFVENWVHQIHLLMAFGRRANQVTRPCYALSSCIPSSPGLKITWQNVLRPSTNSLMCPTSFQPGAAIHGRPVVCELNQRGQVRRDVFAELRFLNDKELMQTRAQNTLYILRLPHYMWARNRKEFDKNKYVETFASATTSCNINVHCPMIE